LDLYIKRPDPNANIGIDFKNLGIPTLKELQNGVSKTQSPKYKNNFVAKGTLNN